MSCIYCNGGRALIDRSSRLSLKGDFWPGICVSLAGNELWVESVADTYEPNYMEETVKINFCPMCGEKLLRDVKVG